MKEKKGKIDSAKAKTKKAQLAEGVAKAKAENEKKQNIADGQNVNASAGEQDASAKSDSWANELKKDKREVAQAEKCAKQQVETTKSEDKTKIAHKAKTAKKEKDAEKKADANIAKREKKEAAKEKLEEEAAKAEFAKQEAAA